jgi:hypothetical protein
MIRTAFGWRAGLWALGALIPASMVPLMIYHAGLDAWQEPIAFIYLHLALLLLFPALILPIALLNSDSRGAIAWATAVALVLYTAFYAAYDALGGLTVGIVYEHAQQTGDPAIATFAQTSLGDPARDLVQLVGTLGWTAALGLTIVHWWRAGRRSPLLGLLGISAIALWWNHPGLPGVITYGSLALATLLLPRVGSSAHRLRPQRASQTS